MIFKSSTAPAAVMGYRGLRGPAGGGRLLLLALLFIAIAASPRTSAAAAPMAGSETAAAGVSAYPFSPTISAAFRGVRGLSRQALASALDAVSAARARGIAGQRDDLLTIIDYSLPSTAPRLWVLDLASGRVLFHELVAHGAGSGDNYATRFSNDMDSRQSSLGLFLTAGTYEGGNGYSLRLRGLDTGVNDRAEERRIVIHGAWYVSPDHALRYGRLGRSWGCPALPEESARRVIDAIKDGSFVFSYSGRVTGNGALRASALAP